MMLTLDLQFFAGEKTEKATAKKRQDSRKKGQVLKSQDVTSAIVLLSVFLFLFFASGFMRERFFLFFHQTFSQYISFETYDSETVMLIYSEILIMMAFILLPVMIVAMVAAVIGNLLQFGLLFTMEPLKFDLKKLDPIKGLKRIFSIKRL